MPPYNTELSGTGSYIPTTSITEIGKIYELQGVSEEQKEILVKLYQYFNNIALVLNTKETALFPIYEMNSSGLMFGTTATEFEMRPIYYATINFGALPNAGTKSVAHNIYFAGTPTKVKFIDHKCWSTDPVNLIAIPIPYVGDPASVNNLQDVQINVDTTNINITTGIDRTSFTETIVTLYYIKI